MQYAFTHESNYLFTGNNINLFEEFITDENTFFQIDMPGDFEFSSEIIEQIKSEYDPDEEKGGLISFEIIKGTETKFIAKEIVFVANVFDGDKRGTYRPDNEQLKEAYKNALSKEFLPLFFHTHPTKDNVDTNIVNQAFNYLLQQATSENDQALTLRYITYNEYLIRLPDILILGNSNTLFVGLYGGLVAPITFTKHREDAISKGVEKSINKLIDWADTPEKRALALLGTVITFAMAVTNPKAIVPAIMTTSAAATPFILANRDRNDFFGVTYGTTLNIHIPRLSDEEILEYENQAIAAREEVRKRYN